MHEVVLSDGMKDSLRISLTLSFPDTPLEILTLSRKCKALKMKTFILGSGKSKYANSALNLVSRKNYIKPQLALVHHYLQCTFRVEDSVRTILVAVISFFYEHPCHSWFGFPVEVWSRATTPDIFLVPIFCIKSRVVYTENLEDFMELKIQMIICFAHEQYCRMEGGGAG